jgi:6-phosphogluconolactonase
MREIVVMSEAGALAREAADRFVALASAAIDSRGRFTVALSGGSTPRALYELLAERTIDWPRVYIFWGDERCVPPDHPDSNYHMAQQALLSKVNVPIDHIHRMTGEIDPVQAAADYEDQLRHVFEIVPPAFPHFDLILLGLGPDAHTASLFPNTAAIREQQRWVVGHHVEALKTNRLTLTPPIINLAAHVIFLVAGADKARAVGWVVNGPRDPDRFPAQIVDPIGGQVTWLIDQAAASAL